MQVLVDAQAQALAWVVQPRGDRAVTPSVRWGATARRVSALVARSASLDLRGEGMRMKQRLWATLAMVAGAVALAGCGSASKKGGTEAVVQVKVDNTQRATTIEFAPQLIDCGRVARCPTLGAIWHSETPNRATLLVGTWGGQAKVESIEFNVRPHAPLRVRSLAKEASSLPGVTAFVVPMDTIERITLGKGGWVRVATDSVVIEENMYSGERSSPAADAFKRFLYEAYKGTDKELSSGLLGVFSDKPYQPNYGK